MNSDLEYLLKPQKMVRSKHDNLIINVSNHTTISPNVLTMYMSAYFLKKKTKDSPRVEGDIDLLQMFYQHEEFRDIDHWKEIPFADAKLLIWEMKSTDNKNNYYRAKSQLKKEKKFIQDNTNYQDIDCFYCFNVGNSYSWRFIDIK